MEELSGVHVKDSIGKLVVETASSLEGAVSLLADIAERPEMPQSCRSRLYALDDALDACRARMDEADNLLDA